MTEFRMVHFCCPRCKTLYERPVQAVGQKFNCQCGQRLQVPDPIPPLANPVVTTASNQMMAARTGQGFSRAALVATILGVLVTLCFLVAGTILLLDRKPGSADFDPVVRNHNRAGNPSSQTPVDEEDRKLPVAPPPKPKQAESETMPSLLRESFEAIGSRERLEEIKVVRIQGKTHFALAGNVNDTTVAWYSTKRIKYVEDSPRETFAFVLNNQEGTFWSKPKLLAKAQKKLMEPTVVPFFQNLGYSISLSNLLPLMQHGFQVEKGVGANVRGRDCVSVKVLSKDRPDITLFFDRETNLLAKTEFRCQFINYTTLTLLNQGRVEYFFRVQLPSLEVVGVMPPPGV